MPSKRPDYQPGSYYHIFNRGAHHRSIFKDQENYLFVIRKIKQYSIQFDLSVIAYCLMPNHYHLLIRQNGDFKASMLPQLVFLIVILKLLINVTTTQEHFLKTVIILR